VALLQSKIHPPTRPMARLVERRRLAELIAELQRRHDFIWVTAAAGSGKTTAVLEATRSADASLAWLTIDPSDAAPGRLLTYLEAALARALPDPQPVVTEALAFGTSHSEAAALLAEACAGSDVTLVIDELERIAEADAALETLSSFLRFAPSSLHVILISRRRLPLAFETSRHLGGIGQVGEQDLAFTVAEAADALERLGKTAVDAREAVEATGGWVAGVLFEAWRSDEHVHGAGGEADSLSSYLSSEIMAQLTREQQEFLITTSVLGEVTAERAEALGETNAWEILASIAAIHLPVVFAKDARAMRCHPQYREYLQHQLQRRGSAAVERVYTAYGALLASEERHEEAVGAFLHAGDTDAAADSAEQAIHQVLRRLDFDLASTWLARFSRSRVESSPALTFAELLIALEREEYGEGAARADHLMAMSQAPDSLALGPELIGVIAWCYFIVDRIDDARAVLDAAPENQATRVMRFSVGVETIDDETHYRDRPPNSGEPVDGMLALVDLAHGRFERCLDPPARPWRAIKSGRVGALRALGRLDEALALFHSSSFNNWTTVRLYVELMADLSRPEEAWSALIDGRELLARSGSGFYRMFALLLEAMLALQFGGHTNQAAAALAAVEREPTARQRIRIVEQLELWRGFAALLDGNDELAAGHLRRAVDVMVEWDRLLFLPTAAAFLSEAEWRLANEDAADAAADLALDAARRQGSNHLLLQALQHVPAVVSRRLDAEPGSDSPWHDIGRALMGRGALASTALDPVVRVREFGEPALEVDGHEVPLKLAKSYELLSFLATNGRRATRDELLEALFGGRTDDSARSYLRQALNRVRQALPDDAPLIVTATEVRWDGEGLTTESIEWQSRLQQVISLQGRERVDGALRALEPFEGSDYMPSMTSEWVALRREELRGVANDVRCAAAESAFEVGDYHAAESLVRRVLDEDPFRESAWRLLMRVAAALGHGDRVIAHFRNLERALDSVHAKPADSTRRLLEQLRR
jgi:DNA-binding SARP family transcriptional activator